MLKAVFVLVVLMLALMPCAAASAGEGQAVTFQGDVAHTGFASEHGLDPPLRRVWQRRFPSRISYPVIAEGKVFVAALRGPPGGTQDVALVALAARSGKLLWQRALGPGADANPAYDAGRVFVFADGFARAFAAADGVPLWERQLAPVAGGDPPVADGGTVYFADEGLVALRGRDGALLWEVFSDNSGGGSPALSADTAYVAYSCEKLAVRRSDGGVLWRVNRGCHGGGGATPALAGGRLYVRDDYDAPDGLVMDPASGAILRRIVSHYAPAFSGRIGVFPDGRHPNVFQAGYTLVARRLRDGRALWRFRGDRYLDSAPFVVNRTAYVMSGRGKLYGLALRSGRVRWRARLGLPMPAPQEAGIIAGIGAGERLLIVPTVRRLTAFR